MSALVLKVVSYLHRVKAPVSDAPGLRIGDHFDLIILTHLKAAIIDMGYPIGHIRYGSSYF